MITLAPDAEHAQSVEGVAGGDNTCLDCVSISQVAVV